MWKCERRCALNPYIMTSCQGKVETVRPWISGWLDTHQKRKKGSVRDPDVLEFVEQAVLFSTSVIGGLGEAVFALRHTLKGLLYHGLKGSCIFSKTQPLTWEGCGVFGTPSLYISGNCWQPSSQEETACLWVQILWSHSTSTVSGLTGSLPQCLLEEGVVFHVCGVRALEHFMMLSFSRTDCCSK